MQKTPAGSTSIEGIERTNAVMVMIPLQEQEREVEISVEL